MSFHHEYRDQYPNTEFKTQPVRLSDGNTYLMTMEVWFWEKLDILLEVDMPTLGDITDQCVDLANRSVAEEGWKFDHALHELLMYYIYRNYQEYQHFIQGIANDNQDDCITR